VGGRPDQGNEPRTHRAVEEKADPKHNRGTTTWTDTLTCEPHETSTMRMVSRNVKWRRAMARPLRLSVTPDRGRDGVQ